MDDTELIEVEYPDLLSLREARALGHDLATLATAVETGTFWGWDRFGRFRKAQRDDELMRKALDALARAVEAKNSPYPNSPPDSGPLDNPWDECGWLRTDLPDFAAIAEGQTVRRRPATEGAGDGALLLVGVLQQLLVQEQGAHGKAPYSSNAQLISAILERHPDVRGLGERTIQTRFADAKQLLATRAKERAQFTR